MPSKKQGRPAKITPETVSKLEEAFRFGANVTEACFLSGVSRETFYKYFRSDSDFSDKIESARSWLFTVAKSNLAKSIKEGDLKSSLWLLERRNNIPEMKVEDEMPSKVNEDENIQAFERLVALRIQQHDNYLRSNFDLVPKN